MRIIRRLWHGSLPMNLVALAQLALLRLHAIQLDEGWFEADNPPTYPYAPGVGVNFTDNLSIETLDFEIFHSYPESWGQSLTHTQWWDEVISPGLTGDLIWQVGSQLSTGPSPDDGFAVYPTGTVYPVMESAAAVLKARG
ncbi:hypothetical protein ACEPAH_7297 [Sanghuangporus vaninii]